MRITTPIRQDIREAMEKVARKEVRYIRLGNVFVGVAYVGEKKTECVEIIISHKISMRFHVQGDDIIAINGDRIFGGSWDDIDFRQIEECIKQYLSPELN